jgi:hypothetical protein
MDQTMFSAFVDELTKIAGPASSKALAFAKKHKMLLGGLGIGAFAGYKLRGAKERAEQLWNIHRQMSATGR